MTDKTDPVLSLAAGLGYEAENAAGWMAVALSCGERHAIPFNDLQPHEETPMCWCKPRMVGNVWAHNSADGRERTEIANT
jgi:hypothetical protein